MVGDPTFDYWVLNDTSLDQIKIVSKKRKAVEVLPFAPVPEALYLDEDGKPRGIRVHFRVVDQDYAVTIPAAIVHAPGAAELLVRAGGPTLTGEHIRTMIRFLGETLTGRDLDPRVPRQRVVTKATWNGALINAPGIGPVAEWNTELAAYGEVADIDEEVAHKTWIRALKRASRSPKSIIVMGMPIGSVYVEPLKLDNFALHITSESSQGKTESAEIAMSAFGEARKPRGRLYRTWDVSEQAPIALFRQVGCMPVWFDETAVLGDDTRFSTIIFRLAQGTNRMRADAYGGLTEGSSDRWDTCLLSTGEARITTASALSGMQRRVIEVWAPITSRETHEKIIDDVRTAYGWPLRWLVRDPDVGWAKDKHEKLFLHLAERARSQQVEVAQAANIATCAMGFAVLCRLAGLEPPMTAITDAIETVFDETLEAAAERGADIGERGLIAILSALQQHPDRFVTPDEALGERWGVVYPDGVVGIVSEAALKQIFEKFGAASDPLPTLRRLRDSGALLCESDRLKGVREIFLPGKGMTRRRMYLVKV